MVVVSVALFTWSNDAYADQGPSGGDGDASVDQYRERLPTAAGPSVVGHTKAQAAKPLPQKVVVAIKRDGGPRARLLVKVAVSPSYGAPQQALPAAPRVTAPARAGVLGAVSASSGGGRMGWLLAIVVAVTGAVLLVARRRPSGRRGP